MICKIITKHVGNKTQTWDRHINAALWAYRTSFKASLGYTPFHLVYGQEALLPIEVELSSLRVMVQFEGIPKEKLKQCILDLEKLTLSREAAMEYYAKQADKRRLKFNKKLTSKNIKEGSLVLRYNNQFDYNKGDKFVPHWEGPFKVMKKFGNGSYQLMDISGGIHKTRVNGWRIKPYHSQILEEQVSLEQVSLDSDKPLGVIAQDPSLAPHVPCIMSITIGPITRPCIDTFLCNPGTTMEHLSNGRKDECTSRLQGDFANKKTFEQEA